MGTANTDRSTADVDANEVARAYVNMWNTRDYAEIPHLLSETFVMYDPAAPAQGIPGPKREVHGRAGFRQFMKLITTGFPDFEITILELFADDEVVMYEARLTMTHEGPFNGIPPTGRRVELRVVSKLSLDRGSVVEHRVYLDMQEALEQLGLTFPTVIRQVPKLVVGKLQASL